jgi:YbbR domain-containing protein
MKRWIFENFNLKVLAVLIAFLLWGYVDLKQVLDHKHLTLYVELTDIPAGMTLDPAVKTSVSVMLIGKNVKDLEADDLDATASLKGFSPGQEEIVVRPKIEQLPEGVTASIHDLKVHLLPLNPAQESSQN